MSMEEPAYPQITDRHIPKDERGEGTESSSPTTESSTTAMSAKASPTTKNTRRFSPERERQVSVKGAVSAWAVAHIRVVDNKCTCSKQPKAE